MEIDQRYEIVDISGDTDPLKEHPQNPNKGAVELIDESIEENGWFGAVLAQESTGYILAGNHRYRTAKKRGASSIPVIWRDVDDETALRILLVDNESTRRGEIDEDILHEVLSSLSSLDGTGYGSAMHKLEERLGKEQEAEAAKAQATDAAPSDPPADQDPPAPAGGGVPDPASIPDDKYTPDYGIMVVCYSESDQEQVYLALQALMAKMDEGEEYVTLYGPEDAEQDGEPMKRALRLVAV